MTKHSEELGTIAILGFQYDATEIAAGATEVLAYGTGRFLGGLGQSTVTPHFHAGEVGRRPMGSQ